MDDTAVQKIVCQAVVSDQYRARLLGSDREEVLRCSGLDASEQEALLAIHAETIEEFAAGVERVTRLWKRAGNRLPGREPIAIRQLIEVDLPPRSG
jgi:hypothetical protein